MIEIFLARIIVEINPEVCGIFVDNFFCFLYGEVFMEISSRLLEIDFEGNILTYLFVVCGFFREGHLEIQAFAR